MTEEIGMKKAEEFQTRLEDAGMEAGQAKEVAERTVEIMNKESAKSSQTIR